MLVNASPDPYGASREHARDGACAAAGQARAPGIDGSALSSAILYLAIVAIWAVVLVPRWLRPRSAQPQPAEHLGDPQSGEPQPRESQPGESEPGEPQEAAPHAVEPPPAEPQPVVAQPVMAQSVMAQSVMAQSVMAQSVMAQSVMAQPTDGGWSEPDPGSAWADDIGPGEPVPAPPARAARRAEIVQARRRLLAMIVVLTAGAVALAVTGIAAFWVVIPPAVLLTGFLVLLREATRIDAERARRADRARQTAPDRLAGQEPGSFRADAAASPDQAPVAAAAADAAEPPPGAEIIDISGRISDQVYDQYADAADRAVGD
jgi:hypothetical protein